MNIQKEVEALISKADSKVSEARRKKIHLYAEGVKAKIRQAEYALNKLESFSGRTDITMTSTAPDDYEISEQVGFYCDTFWAFLYSSLDVLAQVINQSLKLGMVERDVSLKDPGLGQDWNDKKGR